MRTFILIAFRNILRNKYRSAITISAIAFGLFALIFLKGFIDGADYQMINNYTDLLIGHIQIHAKGFQKSIGLEKTIAGANNLIEKISKNRKIIAHSKRIKDFALISSPENSYGVLLLGIDPEEEKKVSSFHKRIRKGFYLNPQDKNKIIIGKDLAENLKVALEDKVVIMSQAADGSLATAAFEVCGIIDTGAEEIDKNLAVITLSDAQELLTLEDKVSEIVLKISSLKEVDKLTLTLRGQLDTNLFEVLNWKDISPMTYQWLKFDQIFTSLILFIFLIVVASGILNTILMAVLERTREFGIMLALGTKKNQIMFMVAAESFILALTAALIGSIAAILTVNYFGQRGIDLSKFSKALDSFYIGSVIYTRLEWGGFFISLIVVFLTSIVTSLLPAYKAANLKPIEAIRHI